MLSDATIYQTVWAETARLQPLNGATTLRRVQATVGRFVAQARTGATPADNAGFAAPAALPSPTDPGHAECMAMMAAVDDGVASGTVDGLALPTRAVLWEVTASGEPRVTAEQPLPAGADWVRQAPTRMADLTDGKGRTFRFYESDAVPAAGAPKWISGYSGSGFRAAAAAKPSRLPWYLGIGATLVFFLVVGMVAWSGRTIADAYALIGGTANASQEFADLLKKSDDTKLAAVSLSTCVAPASANTPECHAVWGAAVHFLNDGYRWFVSPLIKVLAWPLRTAPVTGQVSLALPMAAVMGCIAALGIALGYGTRNRALGVWINPQNRMSLARAQVTAWTVVVLGGYAAITIFNVGLVGGVTTAAACGSNSDCVPPALFPDIPPFLLGTLGIAFASSMVASVLGGQASIEAFSTRFQDRTGDDLDQNASPSQASLADLFMGELKSNKDIVDISRLQNVVITAILVSGYAANLFGKVHGVSGADITAALQSGKPLFETMPNPGGYFLTLVLGSQVAYLVPKAAGTSGAAGTTGL